MSQEMSGRWVGPCKVADFFKLTMPMKLRKGSKEELPKIDKKFFAGKKPANKKAMVKKTIEFFGTDDFTGIQLVDTSSRLDPSSQRGAKFRPGLSLRDKSNVIDPNSPTQLGEASCGLEVENTMIEIFSDRGPLFELEADTAQQARSRLATHAAGFCSRQHRTHLFFVYLYYPYARFLRFDRAGALVSERIDFTLDCTPLIRFFSRFSKMSRVARGYDPTVQVADELETKLARERLKEWAPDPKYERPVFKMEVYDDHGMPNPRKFLVWGALTDPDSPLGRATRGYPALEVTDGLEKDAPLVFLKEQWRSKALRPEIDTLRELNEAKVEHVPTLLCGGDLPNQVTQTDVFAAEIGRTEGNPIDCRFHVRFVVKEVGRPIERFSSSKEMFRAVYDAFQGHKQAYDKCKLLHRDVSGGNILLVPEGGLLNDWDMAVKDDEVVRGPRAHGRTGTWAFMSIDLLRGERRPHKVSDDLESFFWVVLYYGLLYLPHNKVGVLDDIITAIFEQYTSSGETKGGQGKHVVVMEGDYIGDNAVPPLEFASSEPLTYFVMTILTLLQDWRKRKCAPDPARRTSLLASIPSLSTLGPQQSSMPPPPTQKQMRNDVEAVFQFVLDDMTWPADDKAELHILKKSTGQALGGGTAAGGSNKRKSAIQDAQGDTEGQKSKKAKSIPQTLTGGSEGRKTRRAPTSGIRRSTRLLHTSGTS
ncbi:Fungal-type protein kinase domain-containing protein [Pleurotus pulmonarius]